MTQYKYRPVRFYLTAFIATWAWWGLAILVKEGILCTVGMVMGLFSPAIIAIVTVFTSKSDALKKDFNRKIFNFWKLKPQYIFAAVLLFSAIVASSILLSTLFGESLNQFSITEDFSFTGVMPSTEMLCLSSIQIPLEPCSRLPRE